MTWGGVVVVVVVGGGGFSTIARYSGTSGAACPQPVSPTKRRARIVQCRRPIDVVFATLGGMACLVRPGFWKFYGSNGY